MEIAPWYMVCHCLVGRAMSPIDGRRSPSSEGTADEVSGMVRTKPYSILITDDDRGCREALQSIVESEGFPTRLAACGEEALEIVREEPVHLAFLDMNMPTLSGLETLQMLRQIHTIPCVLITADVTEWLMRQALRAQAFSVLAKPVSKNLVLYTVVRALIRVYGGPPDDPGEQKQQ
jgi:CheY-like chemotaxis protein